MSREGVSCSEVLGSGRRRVVVGQRVAHSKSISTGVVRSIEHSHSSQENAFIETEREKERERSVERINAGCTRSSKNPSLKTAKAAGRREDVVQETIHKDKKNGEH